MTTTVYKPSDVLFGWKKLLEEKKTVKDLVKCDVQAMLEGKDYNGVKYMSNIEVYLGVVTGDKIEYGYKKLTNLQIVKVPIAYGPLAHDHKSRGTTNTGASVSIRPDAMGANDQKVGEAMKLLSDAYEAHLTAFTAEQFARTKKADSVYVPYKTTNKDGVLNKEPMIGIKLKYKLAKDQRNPGLKDGFDITILDATKKVNGKLAPLTVRGDKLCYGNMHEIITMGSEITGTVQLSVNRSNLGISANFTFTSLIVKSAGGNKVNIEEALSDVYSQFLDDAVDEDKADLDANSEPDKPSAVEKNIEPTAVGDDDF